MTIVVVKLLIRVAVFVLVFALAARRHEKIQVHPKIALPLVGLVFALLNTGLYWLLRPVIDLATFGAFALLIPFVLNGLFLAITKRLLRPLRIDGIVPMIWLSVILTAAHGVLYLVLDVLAK